MYGGSGNDSAVAISNDVIYGGDGTDTLSFGASQFGTLYGGAGNDLINVTGVENITGTTGYSVVDAGDGQDTIGGSLLASGELIIYGGAGNDSVTGGSGTQDIIYGGDGADTITALGSFNDIIYGGAGDDLIYSSSSGAAVVYGGEGNDTIYNAYGHSADGATAVVTLSGGEGADEFSFRGSTDVSATLTGGGLEMSAATFTTIADFTRGTDKISLY